jgi:hypothetical protein
MIFRSLFRVFSGQVRPERDRTGKGKSAHPRLRDGPCSEVYHE